MLQKTFEVVVSYTVPAEQLKDPGATSNQHNASFEVTLVSMCNNVVLALDIPDPIEHIYRIRDAAYQVALEYVSSSLVINSVTYPENDIITYCGPYNYSMVWDDGSSSVEGINLTQSISLFEVNSIQPVIVENAPY